MRSHSSSMTPRTSTRLPDLPQRCVPLPPATVHRCCGSRPRTWRERLGGVAGYSVGDLEVCRVTTTRRVADLRRASPVEGRARRRDRESCHRMLRPFTKSVYLSSLDENELVYAALTGRHRETPDPPFPPGITIRATPVLISTPVRPGDARLRRPQGGALVAGTTPSWKSATRTT